MFDEALPVGSKFGGVGALGERAEQGFDEPGVRAFRVRLLRLQPVAKRHQFIDFGDDAVLFGEGWERDYELREFSYA